MSYRGEHQSIICTSIMVHVSIPSITGMFMSRIMAWQQKIPFSINFSSANLPFSTLWTTVKWRERAWLVENRIKGSSLATRHLTYCLSIFLLFGCQLKETDDSISSPCSSIGCNKPYDPEFWRTLSMMPCSRGLSTNQAFALCGVSRAVLLLLGGEATNRLSSLTESDELPSSLSGASSSSPSTSSSLLLLFCDDWYPLPSVSQRICA